MNIKTDGEAMELFRHYIIWFCNYLKTNDGGHQMFSLALEDFLPHQTDQEQVIRDLWSGIFHQCNHTLRFPVAADKGTISKENVFRDMLRITSEGLERILAQFKDRDKDCARQVHFAITDIIQNAPER